MSKLVITTILNWLWDKFSGLIIGYLKRRQYHKELKDIKEKYDKQAELVRQLSLEVESLIALGHVVPEQLKERLRRESRILSDMSDVSHGTLLLNSDGSFSYTPAANYNGTDTFTFKVSDGTLTTGVQTFTINITPVNDAPTSSDLTLS